MLAAWGAWRKAIFYKHLWTRLIVSPRGEMPGKQPWLHTIWRAWHLVLLKLPFVRRRVNLHLTCLVWCGLLLSSLHTKMSFGYLLFSTLLSYKWFVHFTLGILGIYSRFTGWGVGQNDRTGDFQSVISVYFVFVEVSSLKLSLRIDYVAAVWKVTSRGCHVTWHKSRARCTKKEAFCCTGADGWTRWGGIYKSPFCFALNWIVGLKLLCNDACVRTVMPQCSILRCLTSWKSHVKLNKRPLFC